MTHFCETHGPKSVLCTQVLPLKCALCLPPSPPLRAQQSADSLRTQIHDESFDTHPPLSTPPRLRKTDTNLTLPTDFSGASTTVDSETEPDSPAIEKHPLFNPVDRKLDIHSQYRYGRSQGDTCASCSLSVPNRIAEKIPAGAPGSRNKDGKQNTNSGAPVLRSREFVCLRERERRRTNSSSGTQPSSLGSSLGSSNSNTTSHLHSHPQDCHDHTLTYLTAKSPDDPDSFAQLRASVIRTLSCELLPRGMSDGPFCFGDSNTGYTIAYVFRLTDPKARGRRRAYAFVALAGKDASRAFQACPMLWEAFASMAKGIESAAQRHQESQRRKKETDATSPEARTRNYTPVSSFLTSRNNDPDGHPRRAGHTTPRSLAEIVGDENIFTILHQYFVALLRCLGDEFGGLPLAEKPSVYQSIGDESSRFAKSSTVDAQHRAKTRQKTEDKLDIDVHHLESLRDNDLTPTPKPPITGPKPLSSPPRRDDLEVAKKRANKAFKRNPQCAPLTVAETAPRQVHVGIGGQNIAVR